MQLHAPPAAHATRSLELLLESLQEQLQACRMHGLNSAQVAEVTTLRFRATRTARLLRMVQPVRQGPIALQCENPSERLLAELKDARAEAARRGLTLIVRCAGLEKITRDRKVIDSLASLMEDGVEAGADYLSMETRLRMEGPELCLTTSAALCPSSFGMMMLTALAGGTRSSPGVQLSVRTGELRDGRAEVALRACVVDDHSIHCGAKRWPAPSHSKI